MWLDAVAADELDCYGDRRGGLTEMPAQRAVVVVVVVGRSRLLGRIMMRAAAAMILTNCRAYGGMSVRMAKSANNGV